jgi:hypothetical protein
MTREGGGIQGLGARVHLFVRPEERDRFIALFRDVLSCRVKEVDAGFAQPILFVGFDDGSGFSVEFTRLAPEAPLATIDDEHAFRGAWIEFRTAELDRLQAALRGAGVPHFRHAGSDHEYFSAPGGQVFRLIDVSHTGP